MGPLTQAHLGPHDKRMDLCIASKHLKTAIQPPSRTLPQLTETRSAQWPPRSTSRPCGVMPKTLTTLKNHVKLVAEIDRAAHSTDTAIETRQHNSSHSHIDVSQAQQRRRNHTEKNQHRQQSQQQRRKYSENTLG